MKKVIIASGPVIVRDNKVLLNKHGDTNFWKFCGGKVKDGENLTETARRRAQEELGIEINIINSKPFVMHVSQEIGGQNVDVILVHWLAEFKGEINPGTDVQKWDWLEIEKLPENLGQNIIPALKHFGFIK